MPADWGDHGDTVLLFFGLWGCVRECLLSERRREERRSIRPLVSGPATDKKINIPEFRGWFLMIFQLGVLNFYNQF